MLRVPDISDYQILVAIGQLLDEGKDPPYGLYEIGSSLDRAGFRFSSSDSLLSSLKGLTTDGVLRIVHHGGDLKFYPTERFSEALRDMETVPEVELESVRIASGIHLDPYTTVKAIRSLDKWPDEYVKISDLHKIGIDRKDAKILNDLVESGLVGGSPKSGYRITELGKRFRAGKKGDNLGEPVLIQEITSSSIPVKPRQIKGRGPGARILKVLLYGPVSFKDLEKRSHTDRRHSDLFRNLLVSGLIDVDEKTGLVSITEKGVEAQDALDTTGKYSSGDISEKWSQFFTGPRGMGDLLRDLRPQDIPGKEYRGSLVFKPKAGTIARPNRDEDEDSSRGSSYRAYEEDPEEYHRKVVVRKGKKKDETFYYSRPDSRAHNLLRLLDWKGSGVTTRDLGSFWHSNESKNTLERMLAAGLISASPTSYWYHRYYTMTDRGREAFRSFQEGKTFEVKEEDFSPRWTQKLSEYTIGTPAKTQYDREHGHNRRRRRR